jgi:hypothetical protein
VLDAWCVVHTKQKEMYPIVKSLDSILKPSTGAKENLKQPAVLGIKEWAGRPLPWFFGLCFFFFYLV